MNNYDLSLRKLTVLEAKLVRGGVVRIAGGPSLKEREKISRKAMEEEGDFVWGSIEEDEWA